MLRIPKFEIQIFVGGKISLFLNNFLFLFAENSNCDDVSGSKEAEDSEGSDEDDEQTQQLSDQIEELNIKDKKTANNSGDENDKLSSNDKTKEGETRNNKETDSTAPPSDSIK